ncbi:hypothetical protein EDC04DRAFT_2600199 [Pisolithus marmoratus]|nr:hypothetical protein EDC04DRAFT_2600199 [Pisolithus marmoratus]
MSLSGCSQSALTGLDDSDYEESVTNTQISMGALSKSQSGFEELKYLTAYDSEIKTLAKKYGITIELFFPHMPMMNTVSQLSPVNALSFSSADCYTMIITKELCLVAELDAILPKHLHHVQNMNSFHDLVHNFNHFLIYCITYEAIKFAQGMQSGRSVILYKLQDNADQISDLPKAHFVPNFPCLEVPEILKMLGVKDVGMLRPHFMIWYPLLFKNMKVNMRKPFLNWHPLGQILKAALWGKASLAEGFVQCSGPKTNGQRWKVSAVMPGSIAWAATICMFLLSPDSEFPGNGIGHTSKIDYYDVFCAYKWVLVIKWTDTHIQHVIGKMNSFVFGKSGMASTQSTTGAIKNLSAEIDAVLAAMDAAVLSEEEDGEPTDAGPGAESPDPMLMSTPTAEDDLAAAENSSTVVPHCITGVIVPINNTVETTNVAKSGRGRGGRHSSWHTVK